MAEFRPRAGLEEEVADEARSFTDRRLRDLPPGHRWDLTFTSLWDLDDLLRPYRGREAGPEAVGAAHYLGLVLARAWDVTGLRPRFVEDRETEEVAIEASVPVAGGEATYRQRYLRDVCGLVARPPEVVPVVVGHARPGGDAGPLLPRYALGAVLANQPWAEGEWERRPVGEDLPRLMNAVVWLQESGVRHHFPDMTPAEEPVVRAALSAFVWPPLGYRGNASGEVNLAALAEIVRSWGADERGRLRRVVSVLVRSSDADLAWFAGAMARAMGLGKDDPAVAAALERRGLGEGAYPPGLLDAVAGILGTAPAR